MLTLFSSARRLPWLGFAAALLLLGAAARSADETTPTAPLTALDYSGNQQALQSLDHDIAAAQNDPQKLSAISNRLLVELRKNDATFAARQAICQRLGTVLVALPPGAEEKKSRVALMGMLTSDRDVDLARLALEPVPGEAIDALFTNALGQATGRARVALIQSAGARRLPSTVPSLAKLANDADPATQRAALHALAEIGGPAAISALRAVANPAAPAVVMAKLAAAARTPSEAGGVFAEIESDSRVPAHLRAAAWRGALGLAGPAALPRIVQSLSTGDEVLKEVALEAIAPWPDAAIVPALTAKLTSFDPRTEAAVVAALGRRGDPASVRTIAGLATHENAEVRTAAITALGALPGDREVVLLLARIAAGTNSDDARLARQSLAQLTGRDVAATILAGAKASETPVRVVLIDQLAARYMTDAMPLLLALRNDPEVAVRTAAAGALGEIGGAPEQAPLLAWTIGAADEGEHSRALRSFINVTLRLPDPDTRAGPLYTAIERADVPTATRLLPALPRIGGKASADCAARLAIRDDGKLSDAAITTLGRWNDRTALPALVSVVERATQPKVRDAARETALHYMETNRETWSPDATELIKRLLAANADPTTRQRLVKLLNRANDEAAVALAESLQADPAIGEAARDAADTIRANRAGTPKLRGSGGIPSLKNVLDGKTTTRWSVATTGDQWLEIDFRLPRPLHRLTLDESGRTTDFPEHYEVFVTDDPKEPGAVRASGKGARNKTVIDLPAGTRGRYVIIKDTVERVDGSWTISDLYVE